MTPEKVQTVTQQLIKAARAKKNILFGSDCPRAHGQSVAGTRNDIPHMSEKLVAPVRSSCTSV